MATPIELILTIVAGNTDMRCDSHNMLVWGPWGRHYTSLAGVGDI